MFKTVATIAALLALPSMALAADKCPRDLSEAKAMLGKATAASKNAPASGKNAQTPRELAGAKTQDVQAPRSTTQDVQAPRSTTQDVQAPRSTTQDVQAPRSTTQDVRAPRAGTQDVQAPRSENVAKARKLIADSEAACKKGDMALSASKAKEAMRLLK